MRSIRSRVVGLLVVMLAALPVVSYGASIRSIDILVADGITGQDTGKGNGVKTGHIQDGAVTDAKIGGTISGSKITGGTINTTQIANSAVTDAKISGTISGSKLGAHGHNAGDISGIINVSNLPVGSTTGTVAAGEHNHDAIYQKKYGNVAVVAQSGGDYTDPYTAMSNVSTWCSSGSSCLLKIMPGVYNLGANVIPMASGVDVEGSGTGVTKIIGKVSYYAVANTEIRALSIEGNIGMQYAGDTSFKNIYVNALAANTDAIGSVFTRGVISITDSVLVSPTAGFSGFGYDFVPSLLITNSKITAPVAVNPAGAGSNAGNTYIINSELLSPDNTVFLGQGNTIVKNSVLNGTLNTNNITLVNSQLVGSVMGSAKCLNVYDANYNPVTCQ